MKLKRVIDTLEGLDESVKSLYVLGDDGKYRLDVDDSELTTALEKERKAKRDAEAAKRTIEEKYKDIDLDGYRSIMDKFSNDEDAKLLAQGKFDEVLNKRTERMVLEHEKTVKQIEGERDAYMKRATAYEAKVFENGIREVAAKSGILPSAVEDIILRAKGTFKLGEDGTLQAVDPDGEPLISKDGKTGLGVQEWIDSLKDTAPHFFPAQSGAGINGGGKGSSINNPWMKDTWNMTEQGRIYKENPTRAKDLAAQAGHTI